ncbi:MAG: T9SS type A sorting domain-containing protein [Chitinophagales bacterium]
MFKSLKILVFTAFLCNYIHIVAQQDSIPYSISLQEITWMDWPGLQSSAFGEWDGKWFFLAGRIGGMHGMFPPDPFAQEEANHFVWMLDPVSGEYWSKEVYGLDLNLADQLRSTNTEFLQRDNYLYIIGGYGLDSASLTFITFPQLIAVDLEILEEALLSDGEIHSAFRFITDEMFRITGGESQWLNDKAYLFGGQNFSGIYTQIPSEMFTQIYTNSVYKFFINDDGVSLSVGEVEQITDSINFHRRDLNFKPIMYPGAVPGLAEYSGVFQYESNIPWLTNMYLSEDSYTVDSSMQHRFSNYTCPVMSIYDSESEIAYTTFFGGISQFYFDTINKVVLEDLNIPFTPDISTVIRNPDGSSAQFLHPESFETLLGSNAVFIPSSEVPQYSNHVIQLDAIDGEIFAGYIFGGIEAEAGNFGLSSASNKLFKVMLQRIIPVDIHTSLSNSQILIYPNPVTDNCSITNNSTISIQSIFVYTIEGKLIWQNKMSIVPGTQLQFPVNQFVKGIYILRCDTDQGSVFNALIKQ